MVDIASAPVLVLLLLTAGLVLLLSAPLLAAQRQPAAIAALAILLGTALVQILWLQSSPAVTALALLAAALIAAPLLERARFNGLVIAGIVGGSCVMFGLAHGIEAVFPAFPPLTALALVIVAAGGAGVAGGATLKLHPSRHRADGTAIWQDAPQAMALSGWIILTLALAGIAYLIAPNAIGLPQIGGALVGGFFPLISTVPRDALQKCGEGLAAGLLLTMLAPLSPSGAALAGLFAGFLVTRSEMIALSLRLDDPHHFLGALIMPAMLGLLMPGILDTALLASQIQWLGAALLLAAALSAVLWPLIMMLVGLALPPRLVRARAR